MKILIDMQGLQTPFSSGRGVGTYIESLAREFSSINKSHELGFIFNAEFSDEYFKCIERLNGIVTPKNSYIFAQQILDGYYSAREDEIKAAELFYTAFVESLNPDILFSPNLQEGLHDRAVCTFAAASDRFAQIATLHDMVPMYLESEYLSDPNTRRWYSRKIQDATRCDRIVTVSETSKSDIRRFVGVSADKIEAIANGYDASTFNTRSMAGERAKIRTFIRDDRDYILYFGGADDHKNIVRLIEAFATIGAGARDKYSLVLGGRDMVSARKIFKAIEACGVGQQVLMPGYVPDEFLPALIRQASLFVFPSTHEGFGLPPLEAMACGTPTIASETSAVGEVVANEEAMFDPLDTREIADRLRRALTDKDWRESLRRAGLERAKNFSWRASAEKLMAVFEAEYDRHRRKGPLSFISKRVANAIPENAPDLARSVAITIGETAPGRNSRNVYVDASSTALYGGHSGIQRVVREIARYLPAAFEGRDAQVRIVYAPEGTTEFRALSLGAEELAPDPEKDEVIDFSPNDILLFLDLHPGLAIRLEQRIQRMRALGVKVCHVVYDVLPVLMPEKFWPDLQQEFYRWLQCISRSDGLLCISRTVAEQVVQYLSKYGVERSEPLRVGYFPLGSDFTVALSPSASVTNGHRVHGRVDAGPSFLMVGTLEPRKAHEQVIKAFELAWAAGENWQLTIVGKQGWKMNRLGQYIREHSELGRRLHWLQGAGDEVLRQNYLAADCVICASEGEGFGLPLIEAAQAGKPVIARDIPVFREVAGEAAFYFDDVRTPESLKKSIGDWVNAFNRAEHPKPNEARALSWREAAEALVSAIEAPTWPLTVQGGGSIDLINPVSMAGPNIRRSGFYAAEGSFAWTAGRASIEFRTTEAYENLAVELECFSWMRMPFHILVNGKRVFSGSANTSADIYRFTSTEIRRGENRIEFVSDSAGSPDVDNRILGLALKRCNLVALQPVKLDQWINVGDLNVKWDGFSQVEFDWRWSTRKTSQIRFVLADNVYGAMISFYCRGAQAYQATFVVNGNVVETRPLPKDVRTIQLPPCDLNKGENVLEIRIPDVSPFSSDDRRKLGLTVLEFQVGQPDDAHELSSIKHARSVEPQSA